MSGKGEGKGRYNIAEDFCQGCGNWHETVLRYCCMCWHVFVEQQRQSYNDQVAFFPPELESNMMQARREAYENMVNGQTVRHRQELVERFRAQEREHEAARLDALRAADEASEDTFVLSNWIANKYIYI